MTLSYFTPSLTVDQIIGENVLLWLRRQGKQQIELAEFVGLHKSSLSRKVLGKTSWSAEDLVKSAAFLQVPLSALLPESAVEMAKAPEPVGSEASHSVAGAGFEPTTSGL
ncbi:MAG: helix-turn-helix domain-containing protein [Flaviflexus sp.]|uniref:helix-turn-helix domain-containing protein n=1 Tax=Flaviflexus sp. TaxID=1969482 RepID=UPI003F929EC8